MNPTPAATPAATGPDNLEAINPASLVPALGFLGLALYQAVNERNMAAAIQAVLSAIGLIGIGPQVHAALMAEYAPSQGGPAA